MVRGVLVLIAIAGASAHADDLDALGREPVVSPAIRTLEADLEAAYGELQAGKPDAIEQLTRLRARAERLTGTTATRGLDVSLAASVGGAKVRVLSGSDFAVVVDRKNEPVAWYALDTPKTPCPPCSSDARTIVVRAASPRLVVLLGRETGPEMVVDLTTLSVRVPSGQFSGEPAPSPDGKRLALVSLTYDETGECFTSLTVVAATGTQATSLGGPIPHDMCQGNYAVAWKRNQLVVTSDWSEDYATIDVKSGTPTTMHGTAPAIPLPRDLSRPLSDKQRAPLAKVGCTVDRRFVFPSSVCGDLAH